MIKILASFFILLSLSFFADTGAKTEEDINNLESQITKVEKQIRTLQLENFNHQAEADEYIFTQRETYLKLIEEVEKNQQDIHNLKLELKSLKHKKQALLESKA